MNRRELLISGALGGAAIAVSYNPLLNSLDNFIRKRIETVNEEELEKIISNIDKRKSSELENHVEGIKENLMSIYTVTDFIGTWNGMSKVESSKIQGGSLIWKDYILTVSHVTNYSKGTFVESKFHPPLSEKSRILEKIKYEKMGEATFYGKQVLEKIVDVPKKDMAILKLPKKYKQSSYEVKLGDSDKLKQFDKVWLIGDPQSQGKVTRPGVIGRPDVLKNERFETEGMVATIASLPGDSGNPLINENGEIIGFVSVSMKGVYTIFSPINSYKNEISKYENAQKLK